MSEQIDTFLKTIPAAIGGILSLNWRKRNPNKSSWVNALEAMFFSVGGYVISSFFVPTLGIQNPKMEQATMFFVGLISMNVVNELYDEVLPILTSYIKNKIKKMLK